jgi:hypothetical protein
MSIKYQKVHSPCLLFNFLTYERTLNDPLLLHSASIFGCQNASSPDNSYTKSGLLSTAARMFISKHVCVHILVQLDSPTFFQSKEYISVLDWWQCPDKLITGRLSKASRTAPGKPRWRRCRQTFPHSLQVMLIMSTLAPHTTTTMTTFKAILCTCIGC